MSTTDRPAAKEAPTSSSLGHQEKVPDLILTGDFNLPHISWQHPTALTPPALLLRAQLQGQLRHVSLPAIWKQGFNAPGATLLMVPNWEVLLTLWADKRPC